MVKKRALYFEVVEENVKKSRGVSRRSRKGMDKKEWTVIEFKFNVSRR
jgi:ribosomal silencing factor RsfS